MELREALYEWNYAAQLLHMRAAEMDGADGSGHANSSQVEREVYQERYLIRRPLLQALQTPEPGAVLLIDEVDRADEPFEAFLLEYLGEYQVSIPEIGTVRAQATPITILTSNRTRELHDAVKRRCLYHWLDYPERERELAIVRAQVPEAGDALSQQVATFVGRLRSQPYAHGFQRAPGIAESVEWARALVALDTLEVDPEVVADTAGILFKQREDVAALSRELVTDLLKPQEVGLIMQLGDARSGKLAGNITGFGRTLRRAGVRMDSARIALAQQAAQLVGVASKADLGAALEAVLVSREQDRGVFRELFEAYFRDPEVANKLLAQMLPSAEGKAEPASAGRVCARRCRRSRPSAGRRRRCRTRKWTSTRR